MKVFFAGTPGIAVPALERLHRDHEIVGVLTNPDRGCGRGREIACCPIKLEADDLGIKTFQPEVLDKAFIDEVKALGADILAVVAFGKIFKKDFIDIFPQGGLNVHPSLLPKYRGASPIQSALLSGDAESGVSIQRLALKMDSGAILRQERYTYKGDETGESLTSYFALRGAELLSETITKIENGTSEEWEQNPDEATYCSYINKSDGEIDWNESASAIERRLRAFTPWPGIFTYFGERKLNIIHATVYNSETESTAPAGTVIGSDKKDGILIQTGDGVLSAQKLQLQSKKALDWKSFMNGVKDFKGAILGG
ncbi:MAG: methionyl-tRNA formyltransferase [Spirochaetales bacterium]|uniref:Methionyl-tRNA formyltransferase n=1 Tax=Candidatus Thalassospirochaeta sargassi TaxID=3119039 RepID=A0AAJ1IDU4_9SPIO|nr:methionyl-tRNA formyltransferase [Spirochaetales bacterium]